MADAQPSASEPAYIKRGPSHPVADRLREIAPLPADQQTKQADLLVAHSAATADPARAKQMAMLAQSDAVSTKCIMPALTGAGAAHKPSSPAAAKISDAVTQPISLPAEQAAPAHSSGPSTAGEAAADCMDDVPMLDPAEGQPVPDEQTSPAKAAAIKKLVGPPIATSMVGLRSSGILRQVEWRPAAESWEHCIFSRILARSGRSHWHDTLCVCFCGDLCHVRPVLAAPEAE